MKFDECVQLQIPESALKVSSRAVSFHPIQQKVCVALNKEVIEYDLITGSRISHFTTSSEISHMAHGYTHDVLVAALKNGCFCVWKLLDSTLSAYHIPSLKTSADRKLNTRKQVMCFGISSTSPEIFFVRVGSNYVQAIEMFSNSRPVVYAHKKIITSLALHPKEAIMAAGAIDGFVKIWNTSKHQTIQTLDANSNGSDSTKKTKRIGYPVTCMAFCDKMLATATQDGRIIIWDYEKGNMIAMTETGRWFVEIRFHPKLPCLVVLDEEGVLTTFSIAHIVNKKETKKWVPLYPFDMVEDFVMPIYEKRPTSKKDQSILPLLGFSMHEKTGLLAFKGKQFNFQSIGYFPLYTIFDQYNPLSTLPICDPQSFTLDIFTKNGENIEYIFPNPNILFLDVVSVKPNCVLRSYSFTTKQITNLQLIKPSRSNDEFHRCVRMRFNHSKTLALTFFETLQRQPGSEKYHFMNINIKAKNEIPPLQQGMDGGFLGQTDNYVILDESGKFVTVYKDNKPEQTVLKCTVASIFPSPFDENTIIYFSSDGRAIGYAHPINSPDEDRLQFDPSRYFFMRENEIPLDILWQKDEICSDKILLGVLTSNRVVILSQDLHMLACVEAPRGSNYYFHSCLWLGNVLFFNTDSSVYCLTPFSRSATHICTLDYHHSVLCAILADRLVFACQKENSIEVYDRYIRIIGPLILCILQIPKDKITYEKQLSLLQTVTSNFDCRGVSIETIELLEEKGFASLASQLIKLNPNAYSWDIKFRVAKSSLDFESALNILKQQFYEDAYEDDFVTEDSEYYSNFVDLAKSSLDYGQFEIAAKCFDMINDVWSLFEIFSASNHRTGLELLAERCSKSPNLTSTYLACRMALGMTDQPTLPAYNQPPLKREPLGVNDITNVNIKVENETTFELTTQMLKGKMKVAKIESDEKENDTPQIDAPEDIHEIKPIELTNLAKWLGSVETSQAGPSPLEELDKLDFATEGFGSGIKSPTGSERGEAPSDNISVAPSDEEPDERSENLPSLKVPPIPSDDKKSPVNQPHIQEPKKEDEDDDEVDEEGYRKRPTTEELRAHIGSISNTDTDSDDSDDDEEDEEDDEFGRRQKMFRGIRIAKEAIKKDEEADAKRLESFGAALRISAPTSSRRRIGTTPNPDNSIVQTPRVAEPVAPKVHVNPANALKDGMAYMEKGRYTEAIKHVNMAIAALVKDNSQVLQKTNIMLCIQYKLLISLLFRIQKLESAKGNPVEIALYAFIISQIPIRIPKHAVICKNMAIKRNMEISNFGIAANLIRQLLPLTPPQFKDVMNQKLKQCEDAGEKNAHPFPEKPNYCWRTFASIQSGMESLKCTYCEATYLPSDIVVPDKTCSYCSYGKLESSSM